MSKHEDKHTHVALTYYKDLTGKYYTSEEWAVPFLTDGIPTPHYDILHLLREMLNHGTRPGLVDGYDFHVHVTVYTEFGPLTHLFVRDNFGKVL